MSFNAGAITGTIGLNTAPLVGAVGRARSLLTGFAADTRSTFAGIGQSVIGNLVGGLGVNAITSAVGGVKKALSFGAQLAMDAEQAQIAFEVMLGSADQAKAVLSGLNTFAANTPFSLPGITEATKTLLNLGVAGDQLLPTIDMLSNVAAGNEEKMKSLALVYGQVASAGRLTGQDLMQFINAGFNPLLEISKRTGESMSALRERMSAGGVGIGEVTQAFVDATSEGGKFFGMNQKQSQSLLGLISTLKDNVGMMLKGISDDLMESIDLKGLVAEFTALIPVIKSVLDTVVTLAVDGFGTLMAYFGATGAAGVGTGNRILAAMEIAGAAIGKVGDAVQLAQVAFKGLQLVVVTVQRFTVQAFTYIQRSIAEALTGMLRAAAEVAAKIPKIGKDIARSLQAAANAVDAPVQFVEGFIQGMEDEEKRLGDELTQMLVAPSASERIAAFFAGIKQQAAEAADATAAAVNQIKIDGPAGPSLPEQLQQELAKLQKEIDQFDMTDLQKRLADFAASPGATPESIEQFKRQMETLRGLQAGSILGDLSGELDALGMNDVERRFADIRKQGILNPDELEEARRLLEEIDAQTKVKAALESIKSPLEQYQEQMAQLNDWLDKGRIDQFQFDRLSDKAQKDAFGGDRLTPLNMAGSAAELALQYDQARASGGDSRNYPKQTVDEQKKSNVELGEIRTLMRQLVADGDYGAVAGLIGF